MKVVFVEGYPGFRGAQRSLAAVAAGMRDEAEVEILCTVGGRAAAGYAAVGLTVEVVEVPPVLRAFGGELARRGMLAQAGAVVCGMLPFALRLWRRWRRDRPDVVHCNQARALLLAAPAARLLGIPVVWHLRGLIGFGGWPRRLCLRLTDHALCVSRAVADSLPSRFRHRSSVVYNGIAARRPEDAAVREALAAAKRDRGLEPAATVLLTASSFVPYKGLHRLVEALGLLCERRPGLRRSLLWVVLGDDESDPRRQQYRNDLEDRLRRAGLGTNVLWAGWSDEVLSWMAAADVTVLPTVEREVFRYDDGTAVDAECSEGFPRTVLESMAAGTAVVATAVAGVREQIDDGVSGLVVPPGDAAALAAAIERLHDDDGLRARLAAAAAERVERFSVERAVRKTLAVYEGILGLPAGRPVALDRGNEFPRYPRPSLRDEDPET
jgi:glycosyltransferase involved in cell wall biosynthesis